MAYLEGSQPGGRGFLIISNHGALQGAFTNAAKAGENGDAILSVSGQCLQSSIGTESKIPIIAVPFVLPLLETPFHAHEFNPFQSICHIPFPEKIKAV